MSIVREHENIKIIMVKNVDGQIIRADLFQGNDLANPSTCTNINLNPHQLYALVDDVAVADPEGWARRFDPRDAIERHLRQVADYLRARAEANRAIGIERGRTLADAFDSAVTRVMEEIESLYAGEIDPTQAVNNNLNRRS